MAVSPAGDVVLLSAGRGNVRGTELPTRTAGFDAPNRKFGEDRRNLALSASKLCANDAV